MNYKVEIRYKIMQSYINLICEFSNIYRKNEIEITKKELLSELPNLRIFTKDEVDKIFQSGISKAKSKYSIESEIING